MKLRSAVAAATVVAASFGLVSPAQAWECDRMEACQQAVMTVCTTIQKVTDEPNCH